MPDNAQPAPGRPGIAPRWTSSAKIGVGTARSLGSQVWFTLSHGIVNEVYYPRIDLACVRDMGLLVTAGQDFFSEEKRDTRSQVVNPTAGIPVYDLRNTCTQGRYRIEKTVLTDPRREVVLQQTRFVPLRGDLGDYRLYVLLAPHLGNRGSGNNAWVGHYKGVPMLLAGLESYALALACSAPWLRRSAGFVGVSDGWQDLVHHKQLTWTYTEAENGNVALTGEIDLPACGGEFTLALGFGRNVAEAGHRARVALHREFDTVRSEYVEGWTAWQRDLLPLDAGETRSRDLYRVSAAVLRTHEAKNFPGGIIASLSIPWGFHKGDNDLGGYHLVWPRDLVQTAGGLLAAGAHDDAGRVLRFLQATQEAEGHWAQNLWLDGTAYWPGLQMDETAFPILLVDLARREGGLDSAAERRVWPMVRRASSFLVRNGPVTQEDRWEEDPGFSPFTLAVEVAALLAAAEMADRHGDPVAGRYLRETADVWNAGIERWTYVTDTDLARQLGVAGYYVRIAPPDQADAASPLHGFVPIKNRPLGESDAPADHLISPDALALVRFGLRAPDDPRILDTLKVIDALLKVDLPAGPAWRRYNGDGYGEHDDGAPFDGTGVGRPWPLLTAERAHYELAAGRRAAAEQLLQAVEAFANESGLLPEQVWDGEDLPERELFRGKASGSAMPLVWAHAEYIKLRHSLREGRVFDMPPQTMQRYLVEKTVSPLAIWRFNHRCRTIEAGKVLRVEVLAPATVHWSLDGWQSAQDTPTRDTGLGVHFADLPTATLPAGSRIDFTFCWLENGQWENRDFAVLVE
jgi:glucoamylase